MKNSCLLISFCLFIGYALAQPSSKNQDNIFFKNLPTKTVVMQKVISRVAPSVGAAIDDTLPKATPVTILMRVPYSDMVGSIQVPYIKVLYKKDSFNRVTFIPASDVAVIDTVVNNKKIYIGFATQKNAVSCQIMSNELNNKTDCLQLGLYKDIKHLPYAIAVKSIVNHNVVTIKLATAAKAQQQTIINVTDKGFKLIPNKLTKRP